MKKLLFATIAFFSLLAIKALASDDNIPVPTGVDPTLCMWYEGRKVCDEGNANYCICIVEGEN